MDGDITQVKADALISTIEVDALSSSGVDGAIHFVADDMFHDQIAANMPLRDGQVIATSAKSKGHNNGRFDNVLFVVDELEQPVETLVAEALSEAERLSFETVSIPPLRTGSRAGVRETQTEALVGLAIAIDEFVRTKPSQVKEIVVVVYNEDAQKKLLMRTLIQLGSSAVE